MNLTFLDQLISFCVVRSREQSVESFEIPESFEGRASGSFSPSLPFLFNSPVPEVKTLSISMSYYLAAEKRFNYWRIKKRFTLLFFAFHRFIRACDLLNPHHCNVLRRFVIEIVHFKCPDLIRLAAMRHNQIKVSRRDYLTCANLTIFFLLA